MKLHEAYIDNLWAYKDDFREEGLNIRAILILILNTEMTPCNLGSAAQYNV
jgi:hypothetical protein